MEGQKKLYVKFQTFWDWLHKNKLAVSLIASIGLVGGSAAIHYKNTKAEEGVVQAISEYQKSLLKIGGEINYDSVECSGIIETQCEISDVSVSFLGQKQIAAKNICFGDIAELAKMEDLKDGKTVSMDFDFSAQELSLPKPIMAEMVRQNVNDAFAQNTLEKLETIDIEIVGNFKGNSTNLEKLELEHLNIENKIMPIRISLAGRNFSSESLQTMVLDFLSIEFEDKAIADVTYESIAEFTHNLPVSEQPVFLKNFNLNPEDLQERAKAADTINKVLANEFEAQLKQASGKTQHQLIEALIKVLRDESDTVRIEVKNEKAVPLAELQKLLSESDGQSNGVSITVSTD